ncbi:unnamed protein product [Boreogadus saida]
MEPPTTHVRYNIHDSECCDDPKYILGIINENHHWKLTAEMSQDTQPEGVHLPDPPNRPGQWATPPLAEVAPASQEMCARPRAHVGELERKRTLERTAGTPPMGGGRRTARSRPPSRLRAKTRRPPTPEGGIVARRKTCFLPVFTTNVSDRPGGPAPRDFP